MTPWLGGYETPPTSHVLAIKARPFPAPTAGRPGPAASLLFPERCSFRRVFREGPRIAFQSNHGGHF